MGLDFKDIGFLGGGIYILHDKGFSWMLILGIGLLAVGAVRAARNI